MVHADFVCIDANPGVGVQHRTIAEVLTGIEENWRVIRFNAVTEENRESMLSRCAHYLQQPYSIRPTNGASAKFSYCSELVSKVYRDSKVRCIKVPQAILINPCHFDRLADKGEACQDITETVKPFVAFFREYKQMLAMQAHALIAGLKLIRYRDKQRKDHPMKLCSHPQMRQQLTYFTRLLRRHLDWEIAGLLEVPFSLSSSES